MKIKTRLQKLRLRLGKILLDKKLPTPNGLLVKRILFLRQDGKIGDTVVSSFVYRELKKADPKVKITVLCSPQNRDFFTLSPYVDEVITIDKRSIWARIQTAWRLRRQYIDILVDPTTLLRNRDLLFMRLVGAKVNIGFNKAQYGLINRNIVDKNQHYREVYQEVVESIFPESKVETSYEIPLPLKEKEQIQAFLAHHHLKDYLCVNLYGAGKNRRFSDEKALNLLNYLLCHSKKDIVLLTYPAVTTALLGLIAKVDEPARLFLYQETQNIFHSIALLTEASLVISPDTAIVHLASGLKKPLISFYIDDENFTHWHPNGGDISQTLRYKKTINELTLKQINLKYLE